MFIWVALVMAVFVYGFVATWFPGGGGESARASDPDSSLATTLAVVAACVSGVSLMLRPIFFGGFQKGTLTLDSPAGARRFITGNIVCFALSESVAIFGLILALSGHPREDWLVFFAATFILMMIHIPLAGRFEAKERR